MSDGSEERPQTKMFWSIKGRSHRLIHVMDLFKGVYSSCINTVRLNKFVQMRIVLL